MNRREFIKYAMASASLLVLPSVAVASANEILVGAERPCAKITHIRIGLVTPDDLAYVVPPDGENNCTVYVYRPRQVSRRDEVPPDDENNYWAEAIEYGDKFYYRVGGTTIEITNYEFRMVISTPRLFYFSTALKLHYRIKRARERGYDV